MEAWMEQIKSLQLKRPLVFFDLETTGTKVGVDRIVEMAMIKVQPDGSVDRKPEEPGKRILVNPEMPIPLESSLVHGVYDADVADAPTFGRIATGLLKTWRVSTATDLTFPCLLRNS
jgi:DNA polymerase-3 subunit epsilon